MRFVAVLTRSALCQDLEDPAILFVVAFGSQSLAAAQVYELSWRVLAAASARRIGTFAQVFGARVYARIGDWEHQDGADLLNALYSEHVLCLNWFFVNFHGSVDCYSLPYPRLGSGLGFDVYGYYRAFDIRHTRDWYRAMTYVYLGEIVRDDWVLREWNLGGLTRAGLC